MLYPANTRWCDFRNDSGIEIPPYGIVRVTGCDLVDDKKLVLTVSQPNVYGSQYNYYVNGGSAVAIGRFGRCAVPDGPVWAAYDDSDTPAAPEIWGPVANSWELTQHVGGFQILGEPTSGRVLVIRKPMLHMTGKTDAAHAKGASGTISIWHGATADALSDSGFNKTDVYNRFADLETTKFVKLEWLGADEWDLYAAEC